MTQDSLETRPAPDDRLDKANGIVSRHYKYAAATGLIPVPLVDLAAISAIQLEMLRKLARVYGVKFTENLGKGALAALLSGSGAVSLASIAQAIPVVGHVIGMLTVGATAGATTFAVGKVFIQHFESGGTLLTFDPNSVRDYYTQQVRAAPAAAAVQDGRRRKP